MVINSETRSVSCHRLSFAGAAHVVADVVLSLPSFLFWKRCTWTPGVGGR